MNRTTLIVDFWWTIALPFICLCSIVTSGFSLLILYKLRHQNRIYRLLYVKTLINLAYLSICFWIFLVKCGNLCPPASNTLTWSLLTFSIQIYKTFIYGFVGNILAYSDLLIEIMLSVERFRLTNNSPTLAVVSRKTQTNAAAERTADTRTKWFKTFRFRMVLVFFASLLVYLPSLFFIKLEVLEQQSPPLQFPYRLQTANAKLYERLKTFTTVFMRSIPTLVLVVFINVINFYYIKRKVDEVSTFHTKNPNTISSRLVQSVAQANRRFKRMLFFQSLLFMLGNSFFVVGYVIVLTWPDGSQNANFEFLPLTGNTLLFTSLGLNYFLWVRHDQRFGEAFEELVAGRDETFIF